jgi:hypothetical protein
MKVRQRMIWEDNIKTNFKELGCEDVVWLQVAVVSRVMNLWIL